MAPEWAKIAAWSQTKADKETAEYLSDWWKGIFLTFKYEDDFSGYYCRYEVRSQFSCIECIANSNRKR